MAGIPHDHYEPKTPGEKWLNNRLPIVGFMYDTLTFPTPKKFELDVDMGDCINILFSTTDNYWYCFSDALYTPR